jgi:hypothetical protein
MLTVATNRPAGRALRGTMEGRWLWGASLTVLAYESAQFIVCFQRVLEHAMEPTPNRRCRNFRLLSRQSTGCARHIGMAFLVIVEHCRLPLAFRNNQRRLQPND